jgi:hypothetical protein
MPVLRRSVRASSGRCTIGSPGRLNEVLSTTGTPVRPVEFFDQSVIELVLLARDRLGAACPVDMGHGGDDLLLLLLDGQPSARGPTSERPWNHPTILDSDGNSAAIEGGSATSRNGSFLEARSSSNSTSAYSGPKKA